MVKLKLQYLATSCEQLTFLKRPWSWERLKAGERDDKGLDGWMASPTQYIWVWASFRRWWRTGKPGVLQSLGLQRVGRNWETDWTTTPIVHTAIQSVGLWSADWTYRFQVHHLSQTGMWFFVLTAEDCFGRQWNSVAHRDLNRKDALAGLTKSAIWVSLVDLKAQFI